MTEWHTHNDGTTIYLAHTKRGSSIRFSGPDREVNAKLFLRAQHMGELVEALDKLAHGARAVASLLRKPSLQTPGSIDGACGLLESQSEAARAILAKIGGGE